MSLAEIVLTKDSANDETALIVAVHAADGAEVEVDQLLFDAESSKATQEIRAPAAGILSHALAVGQEVAFGVVLGRIVAAEALAATSDPAPAPASEADLSLCAQDNRPVTPPRDRPSPRFSAAALALLAETGLSPEAFTTSFVTSADVHALAGRPASRAEAQREVATSLPGSRKRAEIEALEAGAGKTMLSVLGTELGPLRVRRPPGSFLDGRITDIVIYEASRLMRRFPKLNAAYGEDGVRLRAEIHAGLALDQGGRLVVYGIEQADRVGLIDLPDIMADAVAAYVDDRLTKDDLTRATFTVTDLSEGDLSFVLPLLPRGQSCIIGITRDAATTFRLFAGFDHRVTEGREVALFLSELRARLLSYGVARPPEVARPIPQCFACGRTAEEAIARARDKGLLRIVDGAGRDALCCASCWNGW